MQHSILAVHIGHIGLATIRLKRGKKSHFVSMVN